MPLPVDPISGGHVLTNSAGIDDRWTCPNCYADHVGSLEGETVNCDCGATLKLTIEQQPVCVATCVDPDSKDER
jgi:hypothetical protein